jgi:hypothetical protein
MLAAFEAKITNKLETMATRLLADRMKQMEDTLVQKVEAMFARLLEGVTKSHDKPLGTASKKKAKSSKKANAGARAQTAPQPHTHSATVPVSTTPTMNSSTSAGGAEWASCPQWLIHRHLTA